MTTIDAGTDRTTSQMTGVATVGVPVSDQDRAVEFYVGTLGFEKRLDVMPPMFAFRDQDGNGLELVEAPDRGHDPRLESE